MTKSIATLLAMLVVGGVPALAQEVSTDPSNCNLTSDQVLAGWSCTEEVVIYDVSKQFGPGCKDGVVEETIYRIYNPDGALMDESTDANSVVEPQGSDWGRRYKANEFLECHYPVL